MHVNNDEGEMKKFLSAIKEPMAILIVFSLIAGLIFPPHPQNIGLIIVLWSARIGSYFWAGWLLERRTNATVLRASFTGPFLLFLEYFLIRGVLGIGEISNYFSLGTDVRMLEMSRFLIGFVIFFPVAMAIAAFGAYRAKTR